MGTVTAISPQKSDADDRAALRAAIAAQKRAIEKVAAHQETIARGSAIVAQAEAALAKAQAAVNKARDEEARRIADSARNAGQRSRSDALPKARADERDCDDQVQAARSALGALEIELVELQEDVKRADWSLSAAINEFLAPVAADWLHHAQRCKIGWLMARAALSVILSDRHEPQALLAFRDQIRYRDSRQQFLMQVSDQTRDFYASGMGNADCFPMLEKMRIDFEAWRRSLRENPDSPAPSMPG